MFLPNASDPCSIDNTVYKFRQDSRGIYWLFTHGGLFAFDRKNNLSQHWDSKIKDPYASVYGVEKIAEDTFTVEGETFTTSQLRAAINEHRAKFDEYLGKGIVDQLAEQPTPVYESMPAPTKEVIMNLVKGLI